MRLERRLLAVALVALTYWVTGRLGLLLAIPPGYATAIWPPSGVALAALLIGGIELWPGVLLGSLIVNLGVAPALDAGGVATACGIAIGASLQALAGRALLRRFIGLPLTLEDPRAIGLFLLLAGPVACLVGASCGMAVLYTTGRLGLDELARSWTTWWCGDMLGALIVTPLLLVLCGAPREVWRRRRATVALPLSCAFALAVLAYIEVSAAEPQRMAHHFEQLAEPFDDLIKIHLREYLEATHTLRDFHASSQFIDRDEFRSFVAGPIARHRGIAALSWNPLVQASERAAYEARMAAQYGAGFTITERDAAGKPRPAPPRDEYMPLEYVEPLATGRRALGFDVLSDPRRRHAIEASIESNDATATGPVRLARASEQTDLLVYIPVFADGKAPDAPAERRARLIGTYAIVIHVEDLVAESVDPAWARDARLEIDDVSEPEAPHRLYTSPEAPGASLRGEPLVRVEEHEIAGRRWRIRTIATPAYLSRQPNWAPWTVLAAGLLFTSLLGGFLLLVTGRSGRAERLAAQLSDSYRDLGEREAGLRRAQAMARSGHVITTMDGEFETWSETLEQLLGRDTSQMPRSTRAWLALVHPDDRARFRQCALDTRRHGVHTEIEYHMQRGDGEWIQLRQVLEPLDPVAAGEGRSRWFNSIQDVTELKRNEERIRRLNRVHAMLSNVNALIVRVHDREELYREACRIAVDEGAFGMAWIGELDPATGEGRVAAWHGGEPGYVEKIRFSALPDRPESARPACVAAREQRVVICNDIATDPSMAPLREDLLARGHRAIAALPMRVDGRVAAVLALFSAEPAVFDAEELRLLHELAGDIAFALDHLGKAEQLDRLAYFDPLTGLANRNLLHDRLRHALAVAERNGESVAVAFLDLDHFKLVNDSLGHDAGDLLLRRVAQRLSGCVRISDTVARLGGDEFVVLLPTPGQAGQTPERWIADLLQRMLDAIAVPLVLDGRELRASGSIGVSVYPQDGADTPTLLRNADAAMYRAKELGRGRFQFFTADMHERVQARMELESDLKAALERDEFVLHYQPQVDLRSGRIVGLEALLRWNHPRQGLLGPGRFIGLAEESGLIVPIGEWVMARAAMQNKTWQDAGLPAVPVAVNVSARQSAEGNLDEVAAAVLRTTRLPPRYLELELTESLSMANPEMMVPLMMRLKEMGVELSIDDFGTGYSSMSYLKRFPIDKLKLDMSFVREITTDPDSLAISEAIISMAHSLRLKIIAEGVESEGQLRLLAARGCDEMQGYFFSKPLPAADIGALLAEDRRLPSALLEQAPGTIGVLVLDDDPALLARVRAVLAPQELILLTVETTEAAFELLARQEIGVVLCDQRMPRSSGTAFLGKVRQMYPRTRRVLMSAYEDFEAARAAINVGAVYRFLDKSWEPEQLTALVHEALRDYRAADAADRRSRDLAS